MLFMEILFLPLRHLLKYFVGPELIKLVDLLTALFFKKPEPRAIAEQYRRDHPQIIKTI
jgi:hypothetical protein